MKIIFISDIHGKTPNLYKINSIFYKEKADLLVDLGDSIYSSPRYESNPDYSNIEVENILASFKEKCICIRGNCDVIRMGKIIYHDYYKLDVDGYTFHLSHINPRTKDSYNQIYIYGHEHIPYIRKSNNIEICVGSISFPRGGSVATYMIYENKKFTIYDFEGNVVDSYKIGE